MPLIRFAAPVAVCALLLLMPLRAFAATIAGAAGDPENPEDAECLQLFRPIPAGPIGDSGYGLINMCSRRVTIILPVLLNEHRGELTVNVLALGSAGADLGVSCRLRSRGAGDADVIKGGDEKTQGERPSIQVITLKLKRVYNPGLTEAVCRLDSATGVVAYEY